MNKKDCADIHTCGQTVSGVYTIHPDGQQPFGVYCDQTTAGGGWTVFQKRLDGSVNFYRGWNDYKAGFGHLNGEYWLGLDKLHGLTTNNNKRYKLRVDLEDTTGNTAYAEYGYFAVSSEQAKYQLSLGTYQGKAAAYFLYLSLSSGCLLALRRNTMGSLFFNHSLKMSEIHKTGSMKG